MFTLKLKSMTLSANLERGTITSLIINSKERLFRELPLFRVGLRDENGTIYTVSAYDAKACNPTDDGTCYSSFFCAQADRKLPLSVTIHLNESNGEAAWRIEAAPNTEDMLLEWVDFPLLSLPRLCESDPHGNGGRILYPFNEGVLVSDETKKKYREPQYPSLGNYSMFPNMVCSQMLAYLWEDAGLYMGAHDRARGLKCIDFYGENDGVTMQMRLYCGVDFGKAYQPDFDIVWSAIDGKWESAAERYRQWFEKALPPRTKKIVNNNALPEWYADSPLIVSYPVRGIHDTDVMNPNALYPYTNALPMIERIRERIDSRIMVLLMHWEGTAPWAPPYVWPPYGGVENFKQFQEKLHECGDLLGVYCSGFGYTSFSKLDDYHMQEEYDEKELYRGMCASPENKVEFSMICRAQRRGYDICPASKVGRQLLDEAYQPLFDAKLDYVQILDQNHGGGQYLCYSRDHGHPPAPGKWMTENMQSMLGDWNEKAGKTLFGCESAAAEPFIGNLQFSDNRFEINYWMGDPVPLYAYIYHEYVRNFMGNQVSCPFITTEDTLRYRMAYSFASGDAMTVVLNPNEQIIPHWGTRDFTHLPDQEKAWTMITNLTRFYKTKAAPYLYAGRMIPCGDIQCETVEYTMKKNDQIQKRQYPAIHATAWEALDGSRVQILVNPQDHDVVCTVNGKSVTVPALDAIILPV